MQIRELYSCCELASETNLDLVLGQPVNHVVHRDGSSGAAPPSHRGEAEPAAQAESVPHGEHVADTPAGRD